MSDIPQYNSFSKVILVEKGWSEDKKYYIETNDNRRLLLRLSDALNYDRKKSEFKVLKTISETEIPMSQPIDFGYCNKGLNCYMLLTWIEGEDAETILHELSSKEQYEIGVEAGKILQRIHSIPAPATQENWETRFNRKTDNKIKKYLECGIKIDGDNYFFDYIEKNRHLLANRPQSLNHGDYHVGNMIISSDNNLSIIDFNRFDYGDPWEEFNRIVWCAHCSKYFASGRINGYFNNEVPEDFFKLLAFYIISNTLSSVYWAIPFGRKEIETMLNQSKEVLEFYDYMQNPIPKWYTGVIN
ncbi:MAG: aminoglycoside phosphotransferase [Clostridiales bacterium GWF2_38_85]|nr:MAG: aminoglycoside phosphotransferase [Clostridiales bacterium GWF2_38_85]HBL84911.1 phosphotransferase family protein [Clostridiales bacterium]